MGAVSCMAVSGVWACNLKLEPNLILLTGKDRMPVESQIKVRSMQYFKLSRIWWQGRAGLFHRHAGQERDREP